MNKKNILIITERFFPEEFGINDLALAWKQKGYEVAVLTQHPSYPFDKSYDGYNNSLFQKSAWQGIKIYRVFSLMGYKKNVLLKILNYLCYAFLASLAALFIGKNWKQSRCRAIAGLKGNEPCLTMAWRSTSGLATLFRWVRVLYISRPAG